MNNFGDRISRWRKPPESSIKWRAPRQRAREESRMPSTHLSLQEEHHRRQTFREDDLTLLERSGVEFDARYVF